MKRALCIFLLFTATQIVSQKAALLLSHLGEAGGSVRLSEMPLSPAASAAGLLGGYLVLIPLLLATRLITLPAVYTAAAPPRFKRRFYLLAPLGLLLAAFAIDLAVAPLQLDDGGSMARFAAVKHNAFGLLLLCLIGPLTEEIVFRAGFLQAFRRKGLTQASAVLLSSAAFSLIHGNPAQMLPAFLLGLVLALLYLRTADLRLCLPAHIVNNTVVVGLFHVPQLDARIAALPVGATLIAALGLACAAAACLIPILHSPTPASPRQ